MRRSFILYLVILTVSSLLIPGSAYSAVATVTEGKEVSFDYVLTVDGVIVDTSEKSGKASYIQGAGTMLKGVEKNMEGMKPGDTRSFIIPPEEAYGTVNPGAFREIAKSAFGKELVDMQKGQILSVVDVNGNKLPVVVSELRKDTVVLDFNHPLAGKEVQFEVTVLEVK